MFGLHNTDFFRLAMYGYVVATLCYIIYLAFKNLLLGKVATWVTVVSLVLQTIATGLRWKESYDLGFGHIPLSNMYESMVFFAWCLIIIYLYFEWKFKSRALGVVIAPLAFLSIASVSFSPNISTEIEPLVPALQSNWLTSHVATCFFGYAAFAVALGMSIIYLLLSTDSLTDASYWVGRLALPVVIAMVYPVFPSGTAHLAIFTLAAAAAALTFVLGGPLRSKIEPLFPSTKVLDDLAYRAIMVGFPLLTLGIITGAAWANYAWGTYWSWDPKETWSLITWFVYAAYLHARFTAGWRGKRSAVLAVIGFWAVMFTYVWVNFKLSGLHSYGAS